MSVTIGDHAEASCRVLYFHGIPGSPAELELFEPATIWCHQPLWAPDRNNDRSDLGYADYFDDLSKRIATRSPPDGLHLVGFSLGAVAALQVARRLGDRVARIDLISPAAPLELGKFLPAMAGRQVFEAAMRRPWLFDVMTSAQAQLSRIAPRPLVRMLMASAQGSDQELAREKMFRASLAGIVAASLANGAPGYRREILGYVQPWAPLLSGITAPVTLWHGTADNWSPIAMAYCLRDALPNVSSVEWMEGLSHYSTLRVALKRIVSNSYAA